MVKKYKSSWKSLYKMFLFLLIFWILATVGLNFAAKYKNNLTKQYVAEKTKKLQEVKKKFWNNDEIYEKYTFAQKINDEYKTMPWNQRINLIVEKIKELKEMNYQWNTINLSNFSVSLDRLVVNWEVSNLLVLYRSSKNKHFKSVIEMFQDLDFVKDIKIRTYKSDWDKIKFVLDANLTLADGK